MSSRVKSTLYLIILIILLYLSGCEFSKVLEPSVNIGGIYRIPYLSEISCLDPQQCGETSTWVLSNQIYETLFTVSDTPTGIEPLLVDYYKSDTLSLYIVLKKKIKFHDDICFEGGKGRELTAHDVKYSFERLFKLKRMTSKKVTTLLNYSCDGNSNLQITLYKPLL